MKIDGSAIRTGMVIEHKNRLCLVTNHQIGTPGNLRSFNQVEMKDIKTGTKSNERFGSSDKVERVRLDEKTYQYLFMDGDNLTLMDNETYEQIYVHKDLAGAQIAFLQDGMSIVVQSHEGDIISVRLPEKVEMKIVESEPVVKGQTASSSYKPAILENGLRILVPPHIEAGTRVVVDTQEIAYVKRAE